MDPRRAADGGASSSATAGAHGTVRIRVYDPWAGSRNPALVYLHGGGWTLFSLDTHDRVMREYAARAGVAVVGVDYALSPEAKYPVALDAGVRRRRVPRGDAAPSLGIDPARLAIGGDSAGANLAVAAASSCATGERWRRSARLLLNYGVFARRSSPAAVRAWAAPGNMLDRRGDGAASGATTCATSADAAGPPGLPGARRSRGTAAGPAGRPPSATSSAEQSLGCTSACAPPACRRGSRSTRAPRTPSSRRCRSRRSPTARSPRPRSGSAPP